MEYYMGRPLNINDAIFQRVVTLADAYRILEQFVLQYNARGESNTVALLSDVGLVTDGGSADPAQLNDFLACAEQVLASAGPSNAA
jgi:hypothetical protein